MRTFIAFVLFSCVAALVVTITPPEAQALPSEVSATKLMFSAPTENTDDTPLTDLSGFYIYWRQSSAEAYGNDRRVTINDPNITEYQIVNMGLKTDGLYMVVLTAFNSTGGESPFSNEGNFTRRAALYYRSTAPGKVPAAPGLSIQ